MGSVSEITKTFLPCLAGTFAKRMAFFLTWPPATAWPLSEHFSLCVYDARGSARRGTRNKHGIYVLDAFGNKDLIYRDPAISCLNPIPLRPRRRPPVRFRAVGILLEGWL